MSSTEPPAPYFEAQLDMGRYRWTAHAVFKYDPYKARYIYDHVRLRVGGREFKWLVDWYDVSDTYCRKNYHGRLRSENRFNRSHTSNFKPRRHPHHRARILEQLDIIVPAVHNLTA